MKLKRMITLFTVMMTCAFVISVVSSVIAEQTTDNNQNMVNDSNQSIVSKIDINNADISALAQIKGIGEKIAQRIIDYRTANGSFSKIEDLLNVKGIGEKTLEKIRPFIKVT